MDGCLPSVYQYYTTPTISAGLSDASSHFTLNNKNITIYSGALHYFRVPPIYWRDRLKKLRAAGLNTVETYVPWNLHEPQQGVFDFGNGGSQYQDFLNLSKFLKIAKEEDLLAIIRPGPYICSEFEFGGLPSWLLRNKDIKLRTSDNTFMNYVSIYFQMLLSILSAHQFTKGGPIIAFQIENEYLNTKLLNEPIDTKYLEALKKIMKENGLVELFFTSDTPSFGNEGSLPDILNTANFQNDSIKELNILKSYQPNKPLMVMEYWSGWYNQWGGTHNILPDDKFSKELEDILKYPASVNFYMFHGGTNWGFLNGGIVLDNSTDNGGIALDISSYDYNAPLTEAGDYTKKYFAAQALIKKYNPIKLKIPPMPKENPKIAYPAITIQESLHLMDIIFQLKTAGIYERPVSMENLNINNNNGQSYGYIIYRKQKLNIKENSVLKIQGRVCDILMVYINGVLITKVPRSSNDLEGFGYWKSKDGSLTIKNKYENATLDLVVENFGRINFGKINQFNQKKGLWQGDVLLNNDVLLNWHIYPLEFQNYWTNSLINWKKIDITEGAYLHKAILEISNDPQDTFIDMRTWKKGIVIVNGFVLSRYFKTGPQQTVYLPAPFLMKGRNEILLFEHFTSVNQIQFTDKPIFETFSEF